jgi:hypothetical protein
VFASDAGLAESRSSGATEIPFEATDGAGVHRGPSTAVVLRVREAQPPLRMT